MSHLRFSAAATRVGLVWALVGIPFGVAFGAAATELELLLRLFAGSEWFAFKAVFGAFELIVFGLAAALAEQRFASRSKDDHDTAV